HRRGNRRVGASLRAFPVVRGTLHCKGAAAIPVSLTGGSATPASGDPVIFRAHHRAPRGSACALGRPGETVCSRGPEHTRSQLRWTPSGLLAHRRRLLALGGPPHLYRIRPYRVPSCAPAGGATGA